MGGNKRLYKVGRTFGSAADRRRTGSDIFQQRCH